MEKKKLPRIYIQTLPNGYALDYEDGHFMYFNEMDLLAGFIARVGAGSTEEMEKGSILNCIFSVMLGQQYANDIDKLKNTVANMQIAYDEQMKRLELDIAMMDKAIEKYNDLKNKVKNMTEAVEVLSKTYSEACRPYMEYEKRIYKLESMTDKIEEKFTTMTDSAEMLLKMSRNLLDESKKDERMLNARAQVLVNKLERRVRGEKNEFSIESEPVTHEEEVKPTADEGGAEPEKSEDEPKKKGRPKGSGNREKADAVVQKEIEKQDIK